MPQGSQKTEAQARKPCRRRSKGVLETITVKLFQDENAPGPRLKTDEEYVGSLLSKYGDVISHNYRREKISPDDPPPTPRLKIWEYVHRPRKKTRAKGRLTPRRCTPRRNLSS
jgi:hypothetical protein